MFRVGLLVFIRRYVYVYIYIYMNIKQLVYVMRLYRLAASRIGVEVPASSSRKPARNM
jgi:hypothetical protein